MNVVDTSIVVPAFASWHEGHRAAAAALDGKPRCPANVLVESYSVLTRLPHPHRAPGPLVAEFLADRFPGDPLLLSAPAYRKLLEQAAGAGIEGGSVYDALVAATVREAGGVLLTRDRRAAPVYDRIGVAYRFVF